MYRKIRTNYGTLSVQLYDRMKIQPPVFASIADAYNHFVRHPEERQLVDNPDGWRPFGDSLDDLFDRWDKVNEALASRQNKAAGKEAPDSDPPDPPEVQNQEEPGGSPGSDPE